MDRLLVLVRHGQSEWNLKNLFTGWKDPDLTDRTYRQGRYPADRFLMSGDLFRRDEEGFLYFVGRRDQMIKTSGYRVSPTEVEEVAYASGMVGDAVAVAAPHPDLGQAIVLVVSEPSPGVPPPSPAEAGEGVSRSGP